LELLRRETHHSLDRRSLRRRVIALRPRDAAEQYDIVWSDSLKLNVHAVPELRQSCTLIEDVGNLDPRKRVVDEVVAQHEREVGGVPGASAAKSPLTPISATSVVACTTAGASERIIAAAATRGEQTSLHGDLRVDDWSVEWAMNQPATCSLIVRSW
jgi:hypothetical protein